MVDEEPMEDKDEDYAPESEKPEEGAPPPEKPKAFLADTQPLIKKGSEIIYNRVFYGTVQPDGTLRLSPVETLFLLERNRIELLDEKTGQQVDFYEYMQRTHEAYPELWTRYLVYRDLRSRGYIVKEGLSEEIPFRVYPRGSEIGKDNSKYYIYIVREGVPIELTKLDKATNMAKGVGKRLILAVLNRQGEATYYQVSQVSI